MTKASHQLTQVHDVFLYGKDDHNERREKEEQRSCSDFEPWDLSHPMHAWVPYRCKPLRIADRIAAMLWVGL